MRVVRVVHDSSSSLEIRHTLYRCTDIHSRMSKKGFLAQKKTKHDKTPSLCNVFAVKIKPFCLRGRENNIQHREYKSVHLSVHNLNQKMSLLSKLFKLNLVHSVFLVSEHYLPAPLKQR